MAKYRVDKPTYPLWQLAKPVLIRIIFPPLLIWDLLKFGLRKLSNLLVKKFDLVSKFILPALSLEISDGNEGIRKMESDKVQFDVIALQKADGKWLNGVQITPKRLLETPKVDQKCIIYFVGNSASYSMMQNEMIADAETLGVNVVGFDYGGVGLSKGIDGSPQTPTCKKDLIDDGIAQVQRLLKQGFLPENIILKGHSLGGAIASYVGHHFHQQGQRMKVFNDRSFSTFADVITGLYIQMIDDKKRRKQQLRWFEKTPAWLVRGLAQFLLTFTQWDMRPAAAFKAIPEKYREYILVRTPKKVKHDAVDDKVIHYSASMHMYFKSERKALKQQIEKAEAKEQPDQSKINELNKRRDEIKARKMTGGHCSPIKEMQNRGHITADTFFQEFVKKEVGPKPVAPKI